MALALSLDSCPPWSRLSLAFFFKCSGHHRDLHSFPTRRSSDLGPRRRTHGRGARPGGPRNRHRLPVRPDGKPMTISDRKSTRLNSSHGYTSYAVFCLKKKKNVNKDHHIKHKLYTD